MNAANRKVVFFIAEQDIVIAIKIEEVSVQAEQWLLIFYKTCNDSISFL